MAAIPMYIGIVGKGRDDFFLIFLFTFFIKEPNSTKRDELMNTDEINIL